MKPSTDEDGYKSASTESGEGGNSEPPQVILGFAGARRALCPYMIIISQEIRTSSTDTYNHCRNMHTRLDDIYSHFRDEKLTYPKPDTVRLTGE